MIFSCTKKSKSSVTGVLLQTDRDFSAIRECGFRNVVRRINARPLR